MRVGRKRPLTLHPPPPFSLCFSFSLSFPSNIFLESCFLCLSYTCQHPHARLLLLFPLSLSLAYINGSGIAKIYIKIGLKKAKCWYLIIHPVRNLPSLHHTCLIYTYYFFFHNPVKLYIVAKSLSPHTQALWEAYGKVIWAGYFPPPFHFSSPPLTRSLMWDDDTLLAPFLFTTQICRGCIWFYSLSFLSCLKSPASASYSPLTTCTVARHCRQHGEGLASFLLPFH